MNYENHLLHHALNPALLNPPLLLKGQGTFNNPHLT